MRLGENDKVMVLARTDHDDEAQTESIEADTEDEPTAEQLAEMEAGVLLGGINRSVFATADDELRPVMNGIYFDITSTRLWKTSPATLSSLQRSVRR